MFTETMLLWDLKLTVVLLQTQFDSLIEAKRYLKITEDRRKFVF